MGNLRHLYNSKDLQWKSPDKMTLDMTRLPCLNQEKLKFISVGRGEKVTSEAERVNNLKLFGERKTVFWILNGPGFNSLSPNGPVKQETSKSQTSVGLGQWGWHTWTLELPAFYFSWNTWLSILHNWIFRLLILWWGFIWIGKFLSFIYLIRLSKITTPFHSRKEILKTDSS